jgi:hypothetical protein
MELKFNGGNMRKGKFWHLGWIVKCKCWIANGNEKGEIEDME